MFTINVHFLNFTYDGTVQREAEWPPHPGRLFLGLIATAFSLEDSLQQPALAAIDWLTKQPHPGIAFDVDAVLHSRIDSVATGSTIAKNSKHALLRKYQINMLSDNTVSYLFDSEIPEEHEQFLTLLVDNLTYLGQEKNIVIADIEAGHTTKPILVPIPTATPSSQVLRVGSPTFVEATLESYKRKWAAIDSVKLKKGILFNERNISQGYQGGYAHYDTVDVATKLETVDQHNQWIRLKLDKPVDAHLVYPLTNALRRAILTELHGAKEYPYISGHGCTQDHIYFIPLLHRGRIYGIGIMLPPYNGEDEVAVKRALYKAVYAIVRGSKKILHGRTLSLVDHANTANVYDVSRFSDASYTMFETSTPVVLPKFENHLFKRDSALRKAEFNLEKQLKAEGLPVQKVLLISSEEGKQYGPIYHRTRKHMALPILHAHVIMDKPVRGPISIGTAKHFGMGLLKGIC